MPVEPQLPTVGHRISRSDINEPGSLPVITPPSRRVQAPQFWGPPVTEVLPQAIRSAIADLLRR